MDISAFFPLLIPLGVATGALGLWWAFARPQIAVAFLGISLVAGQFGRFEVFGQSGGLLISDIAAGIIVIIALLHVWRKPSRKRSSLYAFGLLVPFSVWSLYVLVVQASTLDIEQVVIAAAYWLRLTVYLLVFPALLVLTDTQDGRKYFQRYWWWVLGALVGIGFIQLLIFPEIFSIPGIATSGWDPHSGRMVSSWLDPNFFGGFLGLVLLYAGLWFFDAKKERQVRILLGIAVLSVALVLTQSRSSAIAAAVAIAVGMPMVVLGLRRYKDRKTRAVQIAIGALMGVGIIGILALVLQERFVNLFFDDPTVNLRVEALRTTWEFLVTKHAYMGVGYNAYQFAALREGVIGSLASHSRAGSDSSIFTLWVTTGVFGVVLFLVPFVAAALYSLREFLQSNRFMLLFPALSVVFLLVHSVFVNSFLYGHMLIVLWILWVLALRYSFHTIKA